MRVTTSATLTSTITITTNNVSTPNSRKLLQLNGSATVGSQIQSRSQRSSGGHEVRAPTKKPQRWTTGKRQVARLAAQTAQSAPKSDSGEQPRTGERSAGDTCSQADRLSCNGDNNNLEDAAQTESKANEIVIDAHHFENKSPLRVKEISQEHSRPEEAEMEQNGDSARKQADEEAAKSGRNSPSLAEFAKSNDLVQFFNQYKGK